MKISRIAREIHASRQSYSQSQLCWPDRHAVEEVAKDRVPFRLKSWAGAASSYLTRQYSIDPFEFARVQEVMDGEAPLIPADNRLRIMTTVKHSS